MIVRLVDFKGEARIPDLFASIGANADVNTATQAEVFEYCEKYEPLFLDMFYHRHEEDRTEIEQYAELPEEQQTDAEKNFLLQLLRTMIADYVAFYYFRAMSVLNSGVGAVIMQPQHANRTDIVNKCVVVWNDMVRIARKLHVEMFGWEYPKEEIFHKINFLGL